MRKKYFKKASDYFTFFNKRRDFIKIYRLYYTKRSICIVYKLITC